MVVEQGTIDNELIRVIESHKSGVYYDGILPENRAITLRTSEGGRDG